MVIPVQIAFHNMSPTEEIESRIRLEADRLNEVFDRIVSCRVVVDVPHRHHKEGNSFQVRIDLKVPGREIAVSREPSPHSDGHDLDTTVRDAFDEARRQLEDLARVRRGDVKAHEPLAHGRVARIMAGEGYGFLETPDGREIYFHRHSVRNGGFDRLEPGAEVVFSEEEGDKGPQATTVRASGRHGHH